MLVNWWNNPRVREYSKLTQKEYEPLSEKSDPLEIMQEIKIQPYWQIVNAQTRIFPRIRDK